MKEYKVYFEIFGKKMKTTIHANSRLDAERKVRNRLVIHKVERQNNVVNDIFEMFGYKNML